MDDVNEDKARFAQFWVLAIETGYRLIDPTGTDVSQDILAGARDDLEQWNARFAPRGEPDAD